MNLLISRPVHILGIGVFMYLSIYAFCVLLQEMLVYALMMFGVNNAVNFFTTRIGILLLFVLLTFIATGKLTKILNFSESKIRKIFLFLFIGYFILQILQFSFVAFAGQYILEAYFMDEFSSYADYLSSNPSLGLYQMFFGFAKILFIGLIFLFESRFFSKKTSPHL